MTDSVAIAQHLVESQFPQWADLPLRPVSSAGTDNHLFRLGDDLVIRLPAVATAAAHAAREAHWLPWFAEQLAGSSAMQLPVPVAIGKPDREFSWPFAICRWVEGSDARIAPPDDEHEAAQCLANFVLTLRALPIDGAPRPDEINVGRGCDLVHRDQAVQRSIDALAALELIEPTTLRKLWQEALIADTWTQPPQWHHGDLHKGNLLTQEGQLTAVIDWGLMAAGDPAVDLLPAWYVFDHSGRETYRRALAVDDASWQRGVGWALSMALIAWPYYLQSNPVVAEESELVVNRIVRSQV